MIYFSIDLFCLTKHIFTCQGVWLNGLKNIFFTEVFAKREYFIEVLEMVQNIEVSSARSCLI